MDYTSLVPIGTQNTVTTVELVVPIIPVNEQQTTDEITEILERKCQLLLTFLTTKDFRSPFDPVGMIVQLILHKSTGDLSPDVASFAWILYGSSWIQA